MTTLTEDMARVAASLEGHTLGHPVENQQESGVYVNFAFNAALVVETQIEDDGKWYYVTMYEWAMDHGVNAEEPIARVRFEHLPAAIVDWLSDFEEDERKTQALLDERERELRLADIWEDER